MEFQIQRYSLSISSLSLLSSLVLRSCSVGNVLCCSEATIWCEKDKAGEDKEPCGGKIGTFSKINSGERGENGQITTFLLSEKLENVSLCKKICQPTFSNTVKQYLQIYQK